MPAEAILKEIESLPEEKKEAVVSDKRSEYIKVFGIVQLLT